MKNLLKSLALVAVSALAVVSCQKNELASQNDGEGVFFSLRTGETKTYIVQDGNKYLPQWTKGDEIGVFFDEFKKDKKTPAGTLKNTNESGATAKFEGTITGAPDEGTLYAFYPASALGTTYDNQSIGFDMPSVQHPTATSFDPAADILVAKPVGFTATDGVVNVENMYFARILATLKVNLKSDFTDVKDQKVSNFKLEATEATLSGRAAVSMKDANGKITVWNTKSSVISATYDETSTVAVAGDDNSVFVTINPETIKTGETIKFTIETEGYIITKAITLASDIVLTPGKCTEINLGIAEENCEQKQDVDYSGEYLIVSGEYLLTDYNSSSKYYNYVKADGAELSDFWKVAGIENYVWTVTKLADGSYSFCNAGSGKYLAFTGSTNNAYEATEPGESTAMNIKKESDASLTVYSKQVEGRNLRYNTSSPRFAFYSGTTTGTAATLLKYTSDPRPTFDTVSGLSWDASGKTLSWTAVEGATNGYEYTTDNGTSIVAVESNSVDCSSWTNGDYSVKVRVVGTDAKKTSEWSSACEFTISGGVAAKYYRKVSSLLEDYEGKFLILGTGTTSAFIGTGSGWGAYSTVTVDNENGIQSNSTVDAYAVTISKLQSGNYTIQASDNNYIASVTSNTFSMGSIAGEFTFEYSNGHSCVKLSNGRYMKFVSGSGFRMYSSSTGVFSDLYKLEEVALSSITVSGTPTKTAYKAGDDFETAGLIATATYEDASTKDVTDDVEWMVTPTPLPLTAGTTSVSVVATYKKVSSEAYVVNGITVTEPAELTSISVKMAPTKVEYFKGENFDPTGLVVYRNYSDETKDEYAYAGHESDFTFNPALTTALTTDINNVTITYQGKSVGQTITVKSIANTKETAYTVAQARALIDAGKDLDTEVYVKGKISAIVTAYSSDYGNISFNISANGKTDGDQFQFYRNFKGANKTKWTNSDKKPAVGNEVIGYGTLTKYGSTYEFAEGNYIVSITEAPYLNASATKASGISADGEEITINVDTNIGSWEAVSSDNTNFKVGSKTATSIKVTVAKNTDTEKDRKATITVSAEGVDDVVITLTQSKAGGVTVTWVAKDASDNPGDAKDWFSGSIDANISWAATKGGSNNPKYYSTGTGLRVYNGGTFTVSAANGKKITKIILTFSGTSYTFSSSNTTTPQTYELSSVSSKNWSVSRTCRLQKVEVTYE